jgi:hypothetical protein
VELRPNQSGEKKKSPNLVIVSIIISNDNGNSVVTLLALDEHGITTVKVEGCEKKNRKNLVEMEREVKMCRERE